MISAQEEAGDEARGGSSSATATLPDGQTWMRSISPKRVRRRAGGRRCGRSLLRQLRRRSRRRKRQLEAVEVEFESRVLTQ